MSAEDACQAEQAAEAAAEELREPRIEQVAVLVSFQSSLHREFCNAAVLESGIMRQYTGYLHGHCENVCSLEGGWPRNHGLGVLLFSDKRECAKWVYSDPVFRAQDFLDQVEMYCVPLCRAAPQGHSVISIQNIDVYDRESERYIAERHCESVEKFGGQCLTATSQTHKARGLRSPAFLVIDAWSCRAECDAWREATAADCPVRRDVVVAELTPGPEV